MTATDIIEAAARALCDARHMPWEESNPGSRRFYHDLALSVVPVIAPLIRAAALEEAASMAEEYFSDNTISGVSPQWVADEIAAMLRALKEQP